MLILPPVVANLTFTIIVKQPEIHIAEEKVAQEVPQEEAEPEQQIPEYITNPIAVSI